MTVPDRVPPHNLDAEHAVLGIVLLEGASTLPRVAEELVVSDFYTDAHRTIYSAMLTMGAAGAPIDGITLGEELRRQGALDQVGGMAKLAGLVEQACIAAHLDTYIAIIRQMSIRRELIQSSTQLTLAAYEASDDVQLLVDRSRETFDRIASRAVVAEQPFKALPLAALLEADIPDPEFLVSNWIPAKALSFVVGDSEAFKSWFTLYLGFCVAAGELLFGRFSVRQAPVLLISEENGLPEDKRRASLVARGMAFPHDIPLHIASESAFSFDDAARYAAMRAYVDEHKIRLVIVDSFVRVHRREEKDAGQMNALYMDRMKPLIRSGVALLMLHHKRKLPSGVTTPPSDNDDIRGSGDIRAAAHAVLFLRTVSDTKVVVRHNKARGWKKQEPFVFGLRDGDQGGVQITYEGKPEDVLDRSSACKAAILTFAQAHATFYRQDLLAALKGKFSKKVVDPMLKELSEKGYPLQKDEHQQGRGKRCFYTFVSAEPVAATAEEEETDVPF